MVTNNPFCIKMMTFVVSHTSTDHISLVVQRMYGGPFWSKVNNTFFCLLIELFFDIFTFCLGFISLPSLNFFGGCSLHIDFFPPITNYFSILSEYFWLPFLLLHHWSLKTLLSLAQLKNGLFVLTICAIRSISCHFISYLCNSSSHISFMFTS